MPMSFITSSVNRTQCVCVLFSPQVICLNFQMTNSIGKNKTDKLNKLMSLLTNV